MVHVILAVGRSMTRSSKRSGSSCRRSSSCTTNSGTSAKKLQQGAVQDQRTQFTIKLNKTGGMGLGLELNKSDGITLMICRVLNVGFVKVWNTQNRDKEVMDNDRIISVNGKSGNAQAMLDVIKTGGVLEMLIQQPTARAQALGVNQGPAGEEASEVPLPGGFVRGQKVVLSRELKTGDSIKAKKGDTATVVGLGPQQKVIMARLDGKTGIIGVLPSDIVKDGPILVVTVRSSLLESGDLKITCTTAGGDALLPDLTMPKDYHYADLQSTLAKHRGMPTWQVELVSPTGGMLTKAVKNGDRVKALTSYTNDHGIECFKEGDLGTVAEVKDSKFFIVWDRTGRETWKYIPLSVDPSYAVVQRAKRFETITLVKGAANDGNLGLEVNGSDGTTLLIHQVKEGMVMSWNKANPGLEARKGNRIVAVNGVTGNSQNLLNACRNDSELKIVVQRDP